MEPLWRMYAGDVLDLARCRTQRYWQHSGAYLNECAYFWGAAFNESYGWVPRAGGQRETEFNLSRWHRWEFQGGLELVWMMLEAYEHTLDASFLADVIIPTVREVLGFYDIHYGVDGRGTIVIEPAQALETWWDCRNPTPEIAGLAGVSERLLALPAHLAPAGDSALWARVAAKLPGLPMREIDGVRVLAPAERFAHKNNVENAELYAVFPYRRIAIGRGDVGLAIDTLARREDRGHSGWRQDDIFMAYLGLSRDARDAVTARAAAKAASERFPAFWGPNYD
jgi:hypothetical protein